MQFLRPLPYVKGIDTDSKKSTRRECGPLVLTASSFYLASIEERSLLKQWCCGGQSHLGEAPSLFPPAALHRSGVNSGVHFIIIGLRSVRFGDTFATNESMGENCVIQAGW